jgi:NAD(P)-dependent dehydrogenase (short-subunit alcohol dehydrogenase family)
MCAYAASEHGVLGLTRVAAMENAAHNIRINALVPGWTETPMVVAKPALSAALCMCGKSPMKDYKKDVTMWHDAFNTKGPRLVDRIISEDWVDIPAAPGQPPGREGMRHLIVQLTTRDSGSGSIATIPRRDQLLCRKHLSQALCEVAFELGA